MYFNPYKYRTEPNLYKGAIRFESFILRLQKEITKSTSLDEIRRTSKGLDIVQGGKVISIQYLGYRLWRIDLSDFTSKKYLNYYSVWEVQNPMFRLFIDYVHHYFG